ncbi:hypothetical protein HDU81_001919 [Chytriomyces hyalinus]|nr:hypothetical protein HDU81_001919 [Chytriomyces hyalinus]
MDPFRHNPNTNFPPLNPTQLQQYLQRIGAVVVEGQSPNLALLNHILDRHSRSIPFENGQLFFLDNKVDINPDALVQRLVLDKRGGYCFQHNTLLLTALLALGFSVTPGVSRSSVWDPPTNSRIYGGITHMELFVENVAGPDGTVATYIADMGYNQIGLTQAIELKVGAVVPCAAGESHTIKAASVTGPGNFMLCHKRAEGAPLADGVNMDDLYTDMFYFTREKFRPQDYEVLNFYVSHCPKHIMNRSFIASMVSETGGRKVVVDRKYSRREDAQHKSLATVIQMESEQQFAAIMKDEFGLNMSAAEIEGVRAKLFS